MQGKCIAHLHLWEEASQYQSQKISTKISFICPRFSDNLQKRPGSTQLVLTQNSWANFTVIAHTFSFELIWTIYLKHFKVIGNFYLAVNDSTSEECREKL